MPYPHENRRLPEESPGLLRVDPFLQTFFLRFNTKRPPFDDARVRRALSLAINRDLISRRVLSGAIRPHMRSRPRTAGATPPRARVDLDLQSARKLLADAGYPGGNGFKPFEVQASNDEVQPAVMEAIQAMWSKGLGIKMTLATLEQKTWIQNQQTLNYDVSTAGWAGDFLDPVTFLDLFVTGGGNNWTGWADKDYDRLISDAPHGPAAGGGFEVFQRAESYLLTQGPVAPPVLRSPLLPYRPVGEGMDSGASRLPPLCLC